MLKERHQHLQRQTVEEVGQVLLKEGPGTSAMSTQQSQVRVRDSPHLPGELDHTLISCFTRMRAPARHRRDISPIGRVRPSGFGMSTTKARVHEDGSRPVSRA